MATEIEGSYRGRGTHVLSFDGDLFAATLTKSGGVVESWLDETYRIHRRSRHPLVVGLDVEWRPAREPGPVAVLQILRRSPRRSPKARRAAADGTSASAAAAAAAAAPSSPAPSSPAYLRRASASPNHRAATGGGPAATAAIYSTEPSLEVCSRCTRFVLAAASPAPFWRPQRRRISARSRGWRGGEAWLRSLGLRQSREDPAIWVAEKPLWHARLSLDVTDLHISFCSYTGPHRHICKSILGSAWTVVQPPAALTNLSFSEDDFMDGCNSHDGSSIVGHDYCPRRSRKLSGSRAWETASETDQADGGYDVIFISDVPYAMSSLKKLYALISKCLRPPYGVLYLASKKNLVGSNGGASQL